MEKGFAGQEPHVGKQSREDGKSASTRRVACWHLGGKGRACWGEAEGLARQPGSWGQILDYLPRDLGHLTFLSSIFLISKRIIMEPTPSLRAVMRINGPGHITGFGVGGRAQRARQRQAWRATPESLVTSLKTAGEPGKDLRGGDMNHLHFRGPSGVQRTD